MREIKNNVEIAKMQNAGLKQDKLAKSEESLTSESEETALKDFSNPTEILGRSQVSKTDNVKQDTSFGVSNPSKIARSDKLFEMAYKNLMAKGDPDAYEKACTIATCDEAKEIL